MSSSFHASMTVTPHGVRHASGLLVWDERMHFGRPVAGYANAAGQAWFDLHLGEGRYAPPAGQPDGQCLFRLAVDGVRLDSGWTASTPRREGDETHWTLRHGACPARITMITRAPAEGWLARRLLIENTGPRPLAITGLAPLAGEPWQFGNHNGRLYGFSEFSGDEAAPRFSICHARDTRWGYEADLAWEDARPGAWSRHSGMNGRSGWSRPALVLRNHFTGSLFCAELAYSGNWRLDAFTRQEEGLSSIAFAVGLAGPPGQALRVLAPGESALSPEAFFTLCPDGEQALVARRHALVRQAVLPGPDPLGVCRVEANHRGYLANNETEEAICADAEIAAKAGAELYVIDAGWFGDPPNNWGLNAGDWFSGPWLPNDLYPIIDRVHALGMKFGLWMELEAAGENTRVRREHPDWAPLDAGGSPVAGGRALDLSRPEVARWVEDQAASVIERYRLDMFRIDHNHNMGGGGARQAEGAAGPVTENTLWRYYDNLYALFANLRRKYPGVSFQNCAGGGGRTDLGLQRFFHHLELSDWMQAPRFCRIYNGILWQLPPEIIMQCLGTECNEQVIKGDLLFQLHTSMQSRFILRGIAPNLAELNPVLLETFRSRVALYKDKLRPVLAGNCRVHQHTPPGRGVTAATPWSINEYALPDLSRGFANALWLSPDGAEGQAKRLFPRLLDWGKTYRVTLDRAGLAFAATGRDLAEAGVPLGLDGPYASELVWWEERP